MELVRAVWLQSLGPPMSMLSIPLGNPLATESWYLLKQPAKLKQAAQTTLPAYHTNTAKTVPQLLHFSRKSKLYLAFFCLRWREAGIFIGWGNTPCNCVLVFKHWAGELLLDQVSDREKFWLICNQEGSRVYCALRIRDSRQDYSWKGCLLRAQCI